MTIDVFIAQVPGLQRLDLERWISNEWVRPDTYDGEYDFCEIDIARARLIRELRDEMDVNEAALPIVLSLLDQLYDLRHRLREIGTVLTTTMPQDVVVKFVTALARDVRQIEIRDGGAVT